MTVTLSVHVMDGVVIAADSTASIGSGSGIANTYDNANKIVNLYKGKPIGISFWGAGSIGNASLSTLAKDLRDRFTGAAGPDGWQLTGNGWSVHSVAQMVRDFFYEEVYADAYGDGPPANTTTGIAVCGYTPGRGVSERYEIEFGEHGCDGPGDEDAEGQLEALYWRGVTDPITRLVMGFGLNMPSVLVDGLGLPPDQVDDAIGLLADNLGARPVHAAMPIQDAIDLADFLVELTKQWVRFLPGAPTVGGPTELAAITKHEGFKWVRRKFYYEQHLNPG